MKNSLEIEIQNLKVENERLTFNQSKIKENKLKNKNESFTEDFKINDDSIGRVKPVRDFSSLKQPSNIQQKGMEKLNELDELIRNFKYRKLNTNHE